MPPIQDRNKSSKNKGKSSFNKTKPSLQRHKSSPKGKTSRGLVRIIAGTHRGRRLPVLISEGLRPTSDRVKETLFNWLMNDINGANCLDMYAGSGGLGIEALSRGANKVVFVEQDTKVAQQVIGNLQTLRESDNAEVHVKSALIHQYDPSTKFDIVFIDPPFGQEMIEKSIDILLSSATLAPNAYIYIETGHNDKYELPAKLSLLKELKTSQVLACLFKLNT